MKVECYFLKVGDYFDLLIVVGLAIVGKSNSLHSFHSHDQQKEKWLGEIRNHPCMGTWLSLLCHIYIFFF